MIKTAFVLLSIGTLGMFNAANDFQMAMPQPVEICSEDPRLTATRNTLQLLGRDVAFAKDVFVTATAKNIDPVLWACNIECESEFRRTAKSKKGYKGLGQTPKAVMKLGYDTADLMVAACTYDEKLRIAKGDQRKAMMFYKGGNNPASRKEAQKVFTLYDKVKRQLDTKEREHAYSSSRV